MPALSRRVHVLLTEPQYARLKDQARLRHESVSAVIRRAIEEHLGNAEQADRLAAFRQLAAMQLPVAGWEQMEHESVPGGDVRID